MSEQYPRPALGRTAQRLGVASLLLLLGPRLAVAQAPQIHPPELIHAVDAEYPKAAWETGAQAKVELALTITRTGTVAKTEVLKSGGAEFDAAAQAAARQWSFVPAKRGDTPVESRIRVPFSFSRPDKLPAAAPAPQAAAPTSSVEGATISAVAPPPPTATPTPDLEGVIDVTVQGKRQRRAEQRSASDFKLDQEVLAAAPRKEGADILTTAPGLYIGRAESPAVAHQYMLRGFDAEHGQDIEFKVGGLPINMPGHIHGQGYADLGFLIGDVVSTLNVSEGVYDPSQGDFAVAGSIEAELGVKKRGVRARAGYGSFGQEKLMLLWAPPGEAEESFGAAELNRTDGFGENRRAESMSLIAQHVTELSATTRLRLVGFSHAARAQFAGVLRNDDYDAGNVCYSCSYSYATANAQNAQAGRVMMGVFLEHDGDAGDSGELGLWWGYDNFSLHKNFTGFIERSRALERTSGRGDLIAQKARTLSLGMTGRYRTAPYEPAPWAKLRVELGASGRVDWSEQRQDLLDASIHLERWDERVDADVVGLDLSMWGDLDWQLGDRVALRLGYRADLLSYAINDHLGNFATLARPQDTYLVGFYRTASGFASGPRSSIEVQLISGLSAQLAYGEGYRSPQPRLLEEGERAPFSKVRSADLGLRWDGGEALQLSVAGYYTHLSDDIAFDTAEGSMQRIGETRRLGAVTHIVSRPWPWLLASVSVTFVEATMLEPPPASAQDPQPAYEEGQLLPYVPQLVVRADVGASHRLVDELWMGLPLDGTAGLGFSALSARPLPYGQYGDAFALLDASVGVSWGALGLTAEVFNLLDTEYEALSYSFASDWSPTDGMRSRVPTRHFSAGAPRSWLLSLEVQL